MFTIRIVVSLPSGLESTLLAHGSAPPPELLLAAAVVGEGRAETRVAEVGKGSGVFVGNAVSVGGGVGGNGVFVGMAA